jgi:hypothetical protein
MYDPIYQLEIARECLLKIEMILHVRR